MLIGGAMAYTFLKPKASPSEVARRRDKLELLPLRKKRKKRNSPFSAVDHVVGANQTDTGNADALRFRHPRLWVSISSQTMNYRQKIASPKTSLNGPMAYSNARFAQGRSKCKAVAAATSSGATSIVGVVIRRRDPSSRRSGQFRTSDRRRRLPPNFSAAATPLRRSPHRQMTPSSL